MFVIILYFININITTCTWLSREILKFIIVSHQIVHLTKLIYLEMTRNPKTRPALQMLGSVLVSYHCIFCT